MNKPLMSNQCLLLMINYWLGSQPLTNHESAIQEAANSYDD